MKNIYIIVFLILCNYNLLFSQNEIENYRNNEITKDEIYQHIKYLASEKLEGRYSGTNGGKLAEDYIAKEFWNYKLTPIGDSLFYQKFNIFTNYTLGKDNSFSINVNSKTNNYICEKDFTPIGISNSAKVKGDIIFAGYGISTDEYDDYKDINAEGKIIIIFDSSPDNKMPKYDDNRYKAFTARGKKAIAIILISSYDFGDNEDLYSLLFDRETQNAGIPIINVKRSIINNLFMQSGYDLGKIQHDIDFNRKANSFALKGVSAEIVTSISLNQVITSNIIGYIKGNDPVLSNEVIVIGAHFDHLGFGGKGSFVSDKKSIHFGADDNASGTAGVLELAQKFSSEKENLKRSIIFICFSGEEEGLLGSAYYVKSDLFNRYNIKAMINMDMIGRLNENKLFINGMGSSDYWTPELTELNKTFLFDITFSSKATGSSDHASFYLKKLPAIHFFTGLHGDYHRPSDTYDKINCEGEAKVLNMIYNLVNDLNLRTSAPLFSSNDDKKDVQTDSTTKNPPKAKVYTGTMPDFSSTEEGYKISGVTPGSPADKAGLKAGDVIIKFGERDIKNISDYMYALSEHSPDEEVEFIIKRNGENINLKIKLGVKKQ